MNTVDLKVGQDIVTVSQEPLRTRFIRSHNRFDLTQPTQNVLIIKTHWGIRLFAKILCFLGFPVLLFGLLGVAGIFLAPAESSPVAALLLVLWGGIMFFMGIWLHGLRFHFDAASGQLSMRFFLWSRQLPLSEIVAIQVIEAGRFASGSANHFGGPRTVFSSYQLNLILQNQGEQRLFVSYNFDLADMLRKAQIVSQFLGVPLTCNTPVRLN